MTQGTEPEGGNRQTEMDEHIMILRGTKKVCPHLIVHTMHMYK